jgi:hypothetical protein
MGGAFSTYEKLEISTNCYPENLKGSGHLKGWVWMRDTIKIIIS